ncbi:hypothetical protein BN871_BF_00120 [Paenibacillus sp. P22]|nr:hypothetical protein BN871_BF_00120 [Paenibacillus sp. P22]
MEASPPCLGGCNEIGIRSADFEDFLPHREKRSSSTAGSPRWFQTDANGRRRQGLLPLGLFLLGQERVHLGLHFRHDLLDAGCLQLLDQIGLAFVQVLDQTVFQRNRIAQHDVADAGYFRLHLGIVEDERFQREVIDAGLPFLENIVRFLRIRGVAPVQLRVPAPVGEAGVVRCGGAGAVLVVAFRHIVRAADAVHREIMDFLVVLQQVDQHERALRIFGCRMDRHAVLRRDGRDFFLVRRDVRDGDLQGRVVPAHLGEVGACGAQILRSVGSDLAGFDILPDVVFVADDVFGPDAAVGEILVVSQQLLELGRIVNVEDLAGGIVHLIRERQRHVDQVPVVVLLQRRLVHLMPFPAVACFGAVGEHAFFVGGDRLQIRCVGFKAVDLRQIVFLAQILSVEDDLVIHFNVVVRHHEQLAVHLRLVEGNRRHVLHRLRRILVQHVLCKLQEAAFQRLVVVISPVSRIDKVEVFVGRELQRVLLVPVGPVEEFRLDRRIDALLELLVQLAEYFVIVGRLPADEQHFQLDLLGGVGLVGSGCVCRRSG